MSDKKYNEEETKVTPEVDETAEINDTAEADDVAEVDDNYTADYREDSDGTSSGAQRGSGVNSFLNKVIIVGLVLSIIAGAFVFSGGLEKFNKKANNTQTYKSISALEKVDGQLSLPSIVNNADVSVEKSDGFSSISCRTEGNEFVIKYGPFGHYLADPLSLYEKTSEDNCYTVEDGGTIKFIRVRTNYPEKTNCTIVNWSDADYSYGLLIGKVLKLDEVLTMFNIDSSKLVDYDSNISNTIDISDEMDSNNEDSGLQIGVGVDDADINIDVEEKDRHEYQFETVPAIENADEDEEGITIDADGNKYDINGEQIHEIKPVINETSEDKDYLVTVVTDPEFTKEYSITFLYTDNTHFVMSNGEVIGAFHYNDVNIADLDGSGYVTSLNGKDITIEVNKAKLTDGKAKEAAEILSNSDKVKEYFGIAKTTREDWLNRIGN